MFIGREQEIKSLRHKAATGSASFIALKGRRRIGKSRLVEEFSKDFKKKYLFTGLPPTPRITGKDQRKEFVNQMKKQGLPPTDGEDWSDIFWVLAKASEQGPVLISLDEIAWMGSKDPTFLGKLKIAWDQHFEKNPKLTLIVASSISSWLDKNLLNSTGFLGRVDLTMTLRELPIKDCCKFWGRRQKSVSAYEKLKVLSVTGGVPKYLNANDPKKSAEENIRHLCFSSSGLLFNEFDRIFHDLFSKRSEIYKEIVEALSEKHSMNQDDISKNISKSKGRSLSEYLNDLVTAGFISADYTWNIKTHETSKLRKYRLSDNYLRFYLKYIAPNKQKIIKGRFQDDSLFTSLKWESIIGLQFENLVIHNSNDLLDALSIHRSECVFDGPFFQTKTKRRKGCQIDYMIQTKNSLNVCEIKFSKNPIGMQIIEEMEKKIKSLEIPRYFSYRPILIQVGGVTDELLGADYFDQIIDWTELVS